MLIKRKYTTNYMKSIILTVLMAVFSLGALAMDNANAQNITQRLLGKILLQVEDKGQAWYVDPVTSTRAYLGRPADAFRIMSELGLGISNRDLALIAAPGQAQRDLALAKRLYGRILLQVENSGEAYYISPVDYKKHFLNRPQDAFDIMRSQGLGITNSDLAQIPVNASYKETAESAPTADSAETVPSAEQSAPEPAASEVAPEEEAPAAPEEGAAPPAISFSDEVQITNSALSATNASIAWTGENYGVVWTDTRSGFKEIYFALLDKDGNKVVQDKKVSVSKSTLTSDNANLIWTGAQFAMVYDNYSLYDSTRGTVYFVRIFSTGVKANTDISIDDSAPRGRPSVAYNGDGYGIVYQKGANHLFTFLNNADAAETSQAPFLAGADAKTSLAWLGKNFGVVYSTAGDGTYLVQIDKKGVERLSDARVSDEVGAAARWNGSQFAQIGAGKYLTIFDSSGSASLRNLIVSETGLNEPSIAWTGTHFGIAGASHDKEIHFAEVGENGSVSVQDTAVSSSTTGSSPSIGYNGEGYGIVWQDLRGGEEQIYFVSSQ